MISKKLEKALNAQVALEAEASFRYLAMASWCENKGLQGCADFFYKHSEEERAHMLKIFHYINDVGGHAVAPKVDQPDIEFKDILQITEESLKGEHTVTASVHELSELASKEKDYGTYNFLQFYVDEQREEEILFTQIIDKIKLIGLDGKGLYYIDKEFELLAASAE